MLEKEVVTSMRKIIPLLWIAIALTGCQSQNMAIDHGNEIDAIEISESSGFGGMNENFSMSFEDSENIEVFLTLMENATEEDVDINAPDYDMKITYEDGANKGIHLSQHEEQIVLMFIGHEEDTYISTPEDSEKVENLIHP